MAGRKRSSAEDIVRKLRRKDELTAQGKTGEEITAELEVSPATLYNWRRSYGGMDTDAAKELKELREQNARLKRLLAEAELVKDALREVAKRKFQAQLPNAAPRRAAPTTCSRPRWTCRNGWRAKPLGWPAPLTAVSLWHRLPPIRTPRCGPGCVPTPPRIRAMGSGVPGRRCATTSAVRSVRSKSTVCGVKGPAGQDSQPAQAGWVVLDPAGGG